MQNINRKCPNSFLFDWNINDDICIYVVKARLSLFPTNFSLYQQDRHKNPRCSFGCFHIGSMAHVLNGCLHHFSNFYRKRHDCMLEVIANFLKESARRYRFHIRSPWRYFHPICWKSFDQKFEVPA